MYLVAWDEANWPERLPDSAEALSPGGRGRHAAARQRHWYATELAGLDEARRALPAVRRVLANVPTYMSFDDHDVSDDWNLTRGWHDQVWRSPGGRRVVANALATYWAFQGWGNAPESFDEQFLAVITAGPGDERFDRAMWSFDRWSYHAPTDPPMLVLDTHTQRSFDSERGGARLLGDTELDRVRELARRADVHAPGPAILVSSTRSTAWSCRSDARGSWSTRSVPTSSTSKRGIPTRRDSATSCGCSSTSSGCAAA